MKKILALLSAVLLVVSCSNDDQSTPKPVTVYAVGGGQKTNGPSGYRAILWENGLPTYLTDGTSEAYGYDVCLNNTDVFVVGSERNAADKYEARLWKNGVVQPIENINGAMHSGFYFVQVFNNDLYVMGRNNGGLKYWKNGVQHDVEGFDNSSANVKGFAVTATNVYVLVEDNYQVKLWNNGVITPLADDTTKHKVGSLCVSGTAVYVLATELLPDNGGTKIKYWKNGVVKYVTTKTTTALAFKMYVEKGDVYITGRESKKAVYWKNGKTIVLEDTATQSIGYAVQPFKGKVYTVGYGGGVRFWKGGKLLYSDTQTMNGDPYNIWVRD